VKNNLLRLFSFLLALFSLSVLAETEELRIPLKNIDRPGIMPTKIVSIDVDGSLKNLKTVDLSFSSKFGITKGLEGQFGYEGFQINPFEAKTTFKLGLKYNYLALHGFSAYLTAKLPVYIFDHIIRDVTVGLPVTFYNHFMAGGFFGDLLKIQMRPNVAAELNFKTWIGFQVVGNLWAELETSFGKVELNNPHNQAKAKATWFWQSLPLELSLLYGVIPHLDIGASVGYGNIIKLEDLSIGLKLTIRAGKLFG
jgi:hypothetical protein